MLRWICVGSLLLCVGAFGCGDETGTGGSGGTILIEPGPTCTAFCDKAAVECEIESFDAATCAQFCEEDLAMQQSRSEACGDAVEAALQCASELDCQELLDQANGENLDMYPCLPELVAADLACPQT